MADSKTRQLPVGTMTKTTVCQYCAVGCGYNAYLVPVNASTEPENAKKVDGVSAFITPAMTRTVRLAGIEYHAAVAPDAKCDLNKGNHSIRGGTQGDNLVDANPQGHKSTEERLISPQVRIAGGDLVDIDWPTLNTVMAGLLRHVTGMEISEQSQLTAKTPQRLGVKVFEYQYLENTYAATKLFYRAIGTPNVAYHDRPSTAGSSPGLKDAGFSPHDFAYDDVRSADIIFIIGGNPYENQSVFFMQNCVGKEIIVMDPRRTATAHYAVKTGGLHLQPKNLGADSLVINAICRALIEACPDDYPLHRQIAEQVGTLERKAMSENNQQRKADRVMGFSEFKQWLGVNDATATTYTLKNAAKQSGIDLTLLIELVKRLQSGAEQSLPKVAVLYEKGLIWGFNYHNTAAVACLGLLLWRPDQAAPLTGRMGGHQKGWAEAQGAVKGFATVDYDKDKGGYPWSMAQDRYEEAHPGDYSVAAKMSSVSFKVKHNLDIHVFGVDPWPDNKTRPDGRIKLANGVDTVAMPDVNLLWIIGGNYLGQTNGSQRKREQFNQRRLIGGLNGQPLLPADSSAKVILAAFIQRMDASGLVSVHQDCFANPTTDLCDIVIPAAGWGEDHFIRYNAQRRLRLYERFQDSPLHLVDAKAFEGKDPWAHRAQYQHSPKPDWMIFSDITLALLDSEEQIEKPRLMSEIQSEFGWHDSSAIADELVWRSNRRGMMSGLDSFARAHGLTTARVHQVLGKDGDGFSDYLKSGYSIPQDSVISQNGVATNGVMLPVKFIADDNPPKLHGTLRITPKAQKTLYFVRADWSERQAVFDQLVAGDDQLSLTCGRVNHLWNNMFHHSRNETIAQRYPEDMPGTLLEVNPKWAEGKGLNNGALVRVNGGNGNGSFVAVISKQASIGANSAFAIFSYPVRDNSVSGRQFNFDGYANNVMDDYWDGINPIGALKYAKVTVTPLGGHLATHRSGPSYAQRHEIIDTINIDVDGAQHRNDRWGSKARIHWQMRELVVTKGLPRASCHQAKQRQRDFYRPDDLFAQLLGDIKGRFAMMLSIMTWPASGPHAGQWDHWYGVDLDFVQNRWSPLLNGTVVRGESDFLSAFIQLSEYLTGFDRLPDRQHAQSILDRLHRDKSQQAKALEALLKTVTVLEQQVQGVDQLMDGVNSVMQKALEKLVDEGMKSPGILSDALKSVIMLWYTGAYIGPFGFPDSDFGPLGDAHYRKGLVWQAIETHPQGYSVEPVHWHKKPTPAGDDTGRRQTLKVNHKPEANNE